MITAGGGPVGERMEECWQKTADRGSKLTSADIFILPLGHCELICVIFAPLVMAHPRDAAHSNSALKI